MTDPQSYRPKDIPTDPGVYRFFDSKDKVIYVGKAKNLKNRLNSYFQSNLLAKTYKMVHSAVRVDWTIVNTELEALQLEFNWIKQESPKYNIQFRDDKSYPYLGVSLGEEFPRLFITRKRGAKGVRYFGPYAHAWALHSTFDVLQKLYPVRTCQDRNFELAKKSKRNCLLGDIGKCSAPCVGRVSAYEHLQIAKDLIHFVEGDPNELLTELENQMAVASAAEEFEKAGRIRDQIHAIKRSAETAGTFLNESISADVVAIHEDITHAAVTLFKVQSGRINGSKSWIIDFSEVIEGESLLQAALVKIYSEFIPPSEILVNVPIEEGRVLDEYLSELSGKRVHISQPIKGEKAELMQTVKRNAHEALVQYLSKRSSDAAVSGRALEELTTALDLPEIPLRIECFDISNTQGTNSVGSMVVFEDGQAKKSDYRRFAITEEGIIDDTRAIASVIRRRFKRYLAEKDIDPNEVQIMGGKQSKFAYPPQLIVVDGGAPQVNAAARALAELGISEIVLVGLAKRLEEVWLPNSKDPLILPRNSEGLYLLQRIRDEAHRFAINFHRSKRSKVMLESLLDEIPQLGEARRNSLLENFGSVSALKKVSEEKLAKVPGIGDKLAAIIYSHLNKFESTSIDTETGEITGS
jgi:excinuclease ABC subunit C